MANWYIKGHHPAPSQAEARREIKRQIKVVGDSHKAPDGCVHNREAIETILRLSRAYDLLKRSNLKKV